MSTVCGSSTKAREIPIETSLDLVWNKNELTLREFMSFYDNALPQLLCVTEGYLGVDGLFTFGTQEIYWVYDIHIQERVTIVDEDLETKISIPINYPLNFIIHYANGDVTEPMPIANVIDIWRVTTGLIKIECVETANVIRDDSLGQQRLQHSSLDLMLIDNTYQEKFLLAHSIIDDRMYPETIVIPLYASIKVTLADGLKSRKEADFKKTLQELQRVTSIIYPILDTHVVDKIIKLPDKLDTTEYSYVEPTAYITQKLAAQILNRRSLSQIGTTSSTPQNESIPIEENRCSTASYIEPTPCGMHHHSMADKTEIDSDEEFEARLLQELQNCCEQPPQLLARKAKTVTNIMPNSSETLSIKRVPILPGTARKGRPNAVRAPPPVPQKPKLPVINQSKLITTTLPRIPETTVSDEAAGERKAAVTLTTSLPLSSSPKQTFLPLSSSSEFCSSDRIPKSYYYTTPQDKGQQNKDTQEKNPLASPNISENDHFYFGQKSFSDAEYTNNKIEADYEKIDDYLVLDDVKLPSKQIVGSPKTKCFGKINTLPNSKSTKLSDSIKNFGGLHKKATGTIDQLIGNDKMEKVSAKVKLPELPSALKSPVTPKVHLVASSPSVGEKNIEEYSDKRAEPATGTSKEIQRVLPLQNVSNNSSPLQNVSNNSSPLQNVSNNSSTLQNLSNNSAPLQNVSNNSSPLQNVSNNSSPHQNVSNNSSPLQNVSNNSSLQIDENIYESLNEIQPGDFETMSSKQVAGFVRLLFHRCPQYAETFIDMEIDGIILMALTQEVMVNDCGLKAIDAVKLFQFVHNGWRPKN